MGERVAERPCGGEAAAAATRAAAGDGAAPMRRVVVLGPPGSGKSTLARAIGARHGLPVFHLDQAYFDPGWAIVPAERFRAAVEAIAAQPAWVVDGNYTDTIGPRLARADTVLYLDVPAWRSLARVVRRMLGSYGQVRRDGPAGCPERLDPGFVWFVLRWNAIRRRRGLAIVAGFAGRRAVLRGPGAVRRFLADGRNDG